MIDSPISDQTSRATLVLLAQLAIVVAGFGFMLSFRKLAGRILLLGVFLAAVAGLLPHVLHGAAP
jgi:hypothetical protein